MGNKSKQKKKEVIKDNGDIPLDKDTQMNLRDVIKAINDLQSRMNIVVQTYINAKGKKGNYRISKDITKLELIKDN